MPVITDPGEPYFKDGIWGWHGAGRHWLPLAVDPATNYLIVNVRGPVVVQQTDPANMRVATHGWDGAVWRRLSQLWGYSDRWAQVQRLAMPANGDYSLTSTAVPAGYVYKLEHATIHNHGGARGMARISIRYGGQEYYLAWTGSPARYEPTIWNGALTLKEGDQIRIQQSTCIAGDIIYAAVWGYKMLIAE